MPSLVYAFNLNYNQYTAFRSIVDYRLATAGLGAWSGLSPRVVNLYINCPDIGGGFRIQHGYSSFVNATRIGNNFLVAHNVTIGEKNGTPVIGDNVMIKTGAVVYGSIVIGDNVTIGPNACVDRDVPLDTICFAPRCVFVKKK